MKFFIKDFSTADLVTFTKVILNRKLHFLFFGSFKLYGLVVFSKQHFRIYLFDHYNRGCE